MIKPLTLLGWMALFGWLSLFGINANALVILQYHHISDKTPFITSTAPEIFEAHLDHLIAENIEVVVLEKALTATLQALVATTWSRLPSLRRCVPERARQSAAPFDREATAFYFIRRDRRD